MSDPEELDYGGNTPDKSASEAEEEPAPVLKPKPKLTVANVPHKRALSA